MDGVHLVGVDDRDRSGLLPPAEHRRDREVARRQPQLGQLGEDLDPARVEAGLLLRLAQRRLDRRLPRVDGPAGERHLAGVRAHVVGALGEQQVSRPSRVLAPNSISTAPLRASPSSGGRNLVRSSPVIVAAASAIGAASQSGSAAHRSTPRCSLDQLLDLLDGLERLVGHVGDLAVLVDEDLQRQPLEVGQRVRAVEVAQRVGQQAVGHAGLGDELDGRRRAGSPGSRCRDRRPRRRTAGGTPRAPASPRGRSRTVVAQKLITIGPRSPADVDRARRQPDSTRAAATTSTLGSGSLASPVHQGARPRQHRARQAGGSADRGDELGHARPSVRRSLAATLRVGRALAVRRAPAGHGAGAARGLAGVAAAPAVPDQVVAEHHPVLLGEQRADRVLRLDRVGLLGPAEAAAEPAEVGVDGDPGDAEGVAEHDVGGLAAHARQGDELVEACAAPRRRSARPGRRSA